MSKQCSTETCASVPLLADSASLRQEVSSCLSLSRELLRSWISSCSTSAPSWWALLFIFLCGLLHRSHNFRSQSTQYMAAVWILSKSSWLSSEHTSQGTSSNLSLKAFGTSTSCCMKKRSCRPSSPSKGIWNFFQHTGQGTLSPGHLSLKWPWRRLRQNAWRQLKSSQCWDHEVGSVVFWCHRRKMFSRRNAIFALDGVNLNKKRQHTVLDYRVIHGPVCCLCCRLLHRTAGSPIRQRLSQRQCTWTLLAVKADCTEGSPTTPKFGSYFVTGSDEEKGLTKTLHKVFHDATHLLCVKQQKDNIVNYMRNNCRVQQSTRCPVQKTMHCYTKCKREISRQYSQFDDHYNDAKKLTLSSGYLFPSHAVLSVVSQCSGQSDGK